MGRQHAQHFSAVSDCQIVGICDQNLDRAKAVAAEYGVPQAFTDVESLLREVDFEAASVVVPDRLHRPITLRLLAAGKHVLCEKPLADSYAEAREMAKAATQASIYHMVNFSYRELPSLQAVAQIVQSGELGEVRHVEARYHQSWLSSRIWGDWRTYDGFLWRLSSAHGGKGVLGDIGVHLLDFATFPVGPLRRVYCQLKTFAKAPGDRVGEYQLDANDSASIIGEYANGAQAVLHCSRCATGHVNDLSLSIHGTRGAIRLDQSTSTTGYQVCLGADVDAARWESREAPPYPSNYARFVEAIATGRPPQPDFWRGAEIQRALDACFASAEAGRPVELDLSLASHAVLVEDTPDCEPLPSNA